MIYGMPGIGGSAGQCALCGDAFLCDMVLGRKIVTGRVNGIDGDLCFHQKCADKLAELIAGGIYWEGLPEGPLRQAFAEAESRLPLGEE